MNKKIIFAIVGVALSATVVLGAVGIGMHNKTNNSNEENSNVVGGENSDSDDVLAADFNVDDVLHGVKTVFKKDDKNEFSWKYTLMSDDSIRLECNENYHEDPDVLEIPEEIDGYPVRYIGQSAFSNWDFSEVKIPNTVKVIEHSAFARCRNLTKINIPNSVERIECAAFENTPWFEARSEPFTIVGDGCLIKCSLDQEIITVPDGVKCISDVFYNKPKMKTVILPETVEVIGDYAFGDEHFSSILKNINLPDNLKEIGNFAFNGTDIGNIEIPASVKIIGRDAFLSTPWFENQTDEFVIVGDGVLIQYNGTSENVIIPDDVKYISNAFEGNVQITDITIPDSVEIIGTSAFFKTGLSEVNVPGSVREINDFAFADCENLVKVLINEGTVILGDRVFYDMKGHCLSELTLPSTLCEVGIFIFNGNMYSITLKGNSKYVQYPQYVPAMIPVYIEDLVDD